MPIVLIDASESKLIYSMEAYNEPEMSLEAQNKKLSLKELIKVIGFSFKMLWRYSKSMLFLSGSGAVIDGVSPIIQAYLAGAILNELALIPQGTASRDKLLVLVIISSLISALIFFFGSWREYMYTAKREILSLALEHDLLIKQASLPLEESETPVVRDKYDRARQGIGELQSLSRSTMDILSAVIGIGGTITVVASTLPVLILVLLPVPFLSIWVRTKNYMVWRTMWDRGRSHRMRAYGIEEMFGNASSIMELKLFGLVKRFLALWHTESLKTIDVRLIDEKKAMRFSILSEILEAAIAVLVDVWLVFRVFAGTIGIGLFEQTRRIVGTYMGSLDRLSSALTDIFLDGYRLNDYRNFVAEDPTDTKPPGETFDGAINSIELKSTSFAYPTGNEQALDGVNFSLKIGEHVAIVGENGAGKTTLLKVMLGLFAPTSGDVLFNGRSVREIDLNGVHRQIAPLLQDYSAFDFLTVKESIAVSSLDNIDEDKVKRVLANVGMLKFVSNLPKGLDSNLGYVEDDGIKLSGGQWQRMAIARALYKEAAILVLDEPTSAVDAKSEQEIIDTIFENYEGKTVIIVSHRISTVKRASRIIMMKDGKVAEEGAHRDLFRDGTAYYELFHKQAKAMSQ